MFAGVRAKESRKARRGCTEVAEKKGLNTEEVASIEWGVTSEEGENNLELRMRGCGEQGDKRASGLKI